VLFDGVDFTTLKPETTTAPLEDIRRHAKRYERAQPDADIGAQLTDACKAHTEWSDEKIAQRSAEVLAMVAIDAVHLKSYPSSSRAACDSAR